MPQNHENTKTLTKKLAKRGLKYLRQINTPICFISLVGFRVLVF